MSELEKTSLPMSKRQLEIKEELMAMVVQFEDRLKSNVPSDPNMIAEDISDRICLLGQSSRMVEISSAVYHWAKGKICEQIMENETLLKGKADVQRLYISGKMAEYEAMVERTKRVIRNMEISIEAMRSILSYEKEQMKMQGGLQ